MEEIEVLLQVSTEVVDLLQTMGLWLLQLMEEIDVQEVLEGVQVSIRVAHEQL